MINEITAIVIFKIELIYFTEPISTLSWERKSRKGDEDKDHEATNY